MVAVACNGVTACRCLSVNDIAALIKIGLLIGGIEVPGAAVLEVGRVIGSQ